MDVAPSRLPCSANIGYFDYDPGTAGYRERILWPHALVPFFFGVLEEACNLIRQLAQMIP
jgi:hypothetical protein